MRTTKELKLPKIPVFDQRIVAEARQRQELLTKPPGSLGRLETLSIQLAGIYGHLQPKIDRKTVIVLAGDHGVTQEGVSAYPASVTRQMVLNFISGGAAINVLARQTGARVVIVDMGIAADLDQVNGLVPRKIAGGTQNITKQPAMTHEQAVQSIQTGIDIIEAECERGLDLVGVGEMGIGNTTSASAITAIMTGLPVKLVTGRGTGISESSLEHKIETIENAISFNQPDPADAMNVLAGVGGFEIGGMAGVILGAASHRVPVVLDGFISGAAALLASAIAPGIKPYLIASHLSVERGHHAILKHLGLDPLLDLELRLGEGTGAVLAFNLVEATARIFNEMATFSEAGVDNKG